MRHRYIQLLRFDGRYVRPPAVTLPDPVQVCAAGDTPPDNGVLQDGIDDRAEVFAASQVDERGADTDGFVGQGLQPQVSLPVGQGGNAGERDVAFLFWGVGAYRTEWILFGLLHAPGHGQGASEKSGVM